MKIYRTPKQMIAHYQRVIEICLANDWLFLVELYQEQLDILWNKVYP